MEQQKEREKLLAGAYQINITPTYPVALTGYVLRESKSTGVLDTLQARGLYLEQGDTKVIIMVCDLLGFPRHFVAELRQKVQAATGVPAANIMVACTHTHSGPATLYLRECGELETGYLSWVQERLVELAGAAQQDKAPVRLRAGKGELHGVSENRRAEGGPVDPEVTVLSLEKSPRDRLAVLFNFTCHPTALQYPNMLVSGDYPGHAMRLVREATGSVPFYFNGATGNIRPVQRNSVEAMKAAAVPLAEKALEILRQAASVEASALSCQQVDVQAPFLNLPDEQSLENVDFQHEKPLFYVPQRTPLMDAKQERIITGWRTEMLRRLRSGELEETIPLEVQVIRIGPLALVGAGGELFVELGLELKERAGLEYLMISCYTNDDVGYIPAAHSYQHGGYELEESFILHNAPAVLGPEAGQGVVEAALHLISQTKVEPADAPQKKGG